MADDAALEAVAARDHDENGSVPDVYVVLTSGVEASPAVRDRILAAVESEIGAFARLERVSIVDELPKTRSGKIMRRLLENISNGRDLGDTTTLRDPAVPEQIRSQLQSE